MCNNNITYTVGRYCRDLQYCKVTALKSFALSSYTKFKIGLLFTLLHRNFRYDDVISFKLHKLFFSDMRVVFTKFGTIVINFAIDILLRNFLKLPVEGALKNDDVIKYIIEKR